MLINKIVFVLVCSVVSEEVNSFVLLLTGTFSLFCLNSHGCLKFGKDCHGCLKFGKDCNGCLKFGKDY